MRLDHIINSAYYSSHSVLVCTAKVLHRSLFILFLFASGHSGEVIPVPIPNTEVKLSYADDTAL